MRVSVLLLLAACAKEEEKPAETLEGGDLVLETPAAGAWAAAGDAEATATAHHAIDVFVYDADGSRRTMTTTDGERFRSPIQLSRGINVVVAEATDERGDTHFARHGVLAGDFGSPHGQVEGAVRLRANQGALDKAAELAASYLDPATLNASLAAVNPVYSDSYIWDTVTVNADVTNVSFGLPDVVIAPSSGRLTLTATLPDLWVDARAYADAFGYDFDTDLALWADAAVVTGTLNVGAEDGRLAVTLEDATVELVEFGYSTDLLPEWVTDYLLVETIRDTITTKIVEQIDAMVPPLLEETLGGLDPSFSTALLGTTVDLAFAFASVDVDDEGLAIGLDLDVAVPESGEVTYEGYLTAGDGEPTVDTHADLSAAVSDDLLNRLLFEAWAGGVLNLRLSTDDGSLEPALLSALKAEQGTIGVTANLPPVVVERDGGLLAQVGELIVTVDTPGGELGEHIVLALAADVPLEVTVSGGELKLELGDPALVFEVRASDWGASNETVTRLIEEMLPLDALLMLLGDFAFPLPSLYGLAVDSGEAERDGDGVHTDVQVWLQ